MAASLQTGVFGQTANSGGSLKQVANGVYQLKILFVNVYFIDTPEIGDDSFVLVDTGLPGFAGKVKAAAAERYGANAAARAIVLTHGHFDHAGSAQALADEWNVPIYAHHLEMPYLTGKSDYPPQDPTVGGALAFLSRFFPHGGRNLSGSVQELPADASIPELWGWRAVHTPGHTAGHVSLWRENDRTLLAGDAFATLNQDSWISNVTETPELYRPPSPLTTDWRAAQNSVNALAELQPNQVAAGHGQPITGAGTADRLRQFAREMHPPRHGRYVNAPARADENGVVALPPPVPDRFPIIAAGVGIGVAAVAVSALSKPKNKMKKRVRTRRLR